MKAKPRIAIVGAGLGGLAAAIMLRIYGFDPLVYEQAARLDRVGAGINLYPNATRIFKGLGLLDQCREGGLALKSWHNREWDTGRVYFSQPERDWENTYGGPHMLLHRGDLQQIMVEMLPRRAIRFGKRLVGLSETPRASRLFFDDGAVVEADIVIGADGVNSLVREELLGPELLQYSGQVSYRGIFPTRLLGDYRLASDGAKYWSDERHWAKDDRHFIFYYLTRARDEVYFVTGGPDPHWKGCLSPVAAQAGEVKACFEGFHEEVQHIIDACPRAEKWPMLTCDPLPLWSRGRTVILGDACHPMRPHMGQSAGMAMEDAVVLSRCIASTEGDYEGAFALYRANRIERTRRVQQISNLNTWMRYPTDPAWCFAYDALTVPLIGADLAWPSHESRLSA
jgi:6-hydroxynicotinate 3-monooxygenase